MYIYYVQFDNVCKIAPLLTVVYSLQVNCSLLSRTWFEKGLKYVGYIYDVYYCLRNSVCNTNQRKEEWNVLYSSIFK